MRESVDRAGWFRRACFCAALVGLAFASAPAGAAEAATSDWARTDQSAVRLIAATDAVGSGGTIQAGLEFELKPGWKTYWRTPGDAGFPVSVDWTGSTNLAAAEMAWPAPHRFSLFGLDTFGYQNQVVFPIAVRAEKPGEPIGLRAKVSYLICEQVCIPYESNLAMDLPAGTPTPTGNAQLINRYLSQVPGDGARHGLKLERVAIGSDAAKPTLEIVARSTLLPFAAPDVIVEAPAGLYFAAPQVTLGADGMRADLSIAVTQDAGAPALADADLTLTLVDGVRGLEQKLRVGAGWGTPGEAIASSAAPASAPPTSTATLWPMLLVALLGGLILNVMPCVLPVLSLKLLGLVGHAQESPGAVRRGFLASAAGILVAFAALAGALLLLKAMGGTIGWGIQFQQPWFLVAMTLLLTLFAANLWGWFEIPLPARVGNLAGVGRPAGLGGQFATGIFATLLATPCSAPFVGTAIGFALARGPVEIVAIFLALGLGFAAPYLLVAAAPSLARLLPRPGRWMIALRRLLGLLLAGTAIWLLTVLAGEVNRMVVWVIGIISLGIAFALWLRHRLPDGLRLASPAAVGLLTIAAFIAPAQLASPRTAEVAVAASGPWQSFDEAAIPALVREGKTVIVDVTADWCVTCLVNKRLVLESADIAGRLAQPSVVAMKADWTKPDEAIARYLAAHGRYAIPFNIVYGPGAPDGILLPELLTPASVQDALNKAAGG
jgi:suppressor for copper-sensitivity B